MNSEEYFTKVDSLYNNRYTILNNNDFKDEIIPSKIIVLDNYCGSKFLIDSREFIRFRTSKNLTTFCKKCKDQKNIIEKFIYENNMDTTKTYYINNYYIYENSLVFIIVCKDCKHTWEAKAKVENNECRIMGINIFACPNCGNGFTELDESEYGSVIINHRKYESRGVNIIKNVLKKQKYEYYCEVEFEDCKNVGYLPFDFFVLFENGQFALMEFDGSQHFKDWKKEPKRFIKTLRKDNIRNIFCKEHNIPLLRIDYSCSEKAIREKVICFLGLLDNRINPSGNNSPILQKCDVQTSLNAGKLIRIDGQSAVFCKRPLEGKKEN